MNSFSLFILLLIITSCSFNTIKQQGHLKFVEKNITNCKIEKQGVNLIIDNQLLKTQFKEYTDEQNLTTSQQYILLSLLQLVSRQESTALNSKIVTVIMYKGKKQVFSYGPTPDSFTYLDYLYDLAEILNISKSELRNLVRKIDNTYPKKIPISKELASFLESGKSSFLKNEEVREYIFRGSQILQEGESLKRPIFSEILNLKSRDKQLRISTIFPTNTPLQCSFDQRLFSATPLIQHKIEKINSNVFGIINDHKNYIVTLTSAKPSHEIYSKKLNIFKTNIASNFNAAICLDSNKIVVSKNSPQAEQIIIKAVENSKILNTEQGIKDFLMKKRELNLIYPERTITEVFGIEEEKNNQNLKNNSNEELYFLPTIGNIDIITLDKVNYIYKDPRNDLSKCN